MTRMQRAVAKPRFSLIVSLCFFALAAACTGVDMPDTSQSSIVGTPDLDIEQYELTFDESFRRLDVSGLRCDSRWIAHTPWRGDFGHAHFVDPSRGFPFIARKNVLRIEARRQPDGVWLSGLLSAYNTCDEGFAQQYGYFEARAMLPAIDGMWPAFWLIGVNRGRYTAEVDIFEHHGHKPDVFTSTIHIHPRADDVQRYHVYHSQTVEPGSLSDRFNLYGVDIGPTDTVFYLNRKEIWRTPTPPELHQPVYPLINLAMDKGFVTENTTSPGYMYVDYVRAYQRKDADGG